MLSFEEKRLIGWIFAILFFGALVKAYLHRVEIAPTSVPTIPSLPSDFQSETKSD